MFDRFVHSEVSGGDATFRMSLGGVGFTMAIFIAELAFSSDLLIAKAKLAILFAAVAAVAAGVCGFLMLQRVLPKS